MTGRPLDGRPVRSDKLLDGDAAGDLREVALHGVRDFVAAEQVLQSLLVHLGARRALQDTSR